MKTEIITLEINHDYDGQEIIKRVRDLVASITTVDSVSILRSAGTESDDEHATANYKLQSIEKVLIYPAVKKNNGDIILTHDTVIRILEILGEIKTIIKP